MFSFHHPSRTVWRTWTVLAIGVSFLLPFTSDSECFGQAAGASESSNTAGAGSPKSGNDLLAEYFQVETRRLAENCLADIHTAEDWNASRDRLRGELLYMLGLDPMPERTDLKATVTGTLERDGVIVENIHFQSRPGLYVTGNLYRPAAQSGDASDASDSAKPEKLPAILYVCGHGGVKKDGVSYGNKVHYQHHGAWFAQHGFVCLIIDSLQLGEIEAIHHGTYRENRWWWLNRGYTPAGVEAWNCFRALDYLQSRNDVDPDQLGVTGRSGGGAYSWWITAIDDRIKASVPVAGITDLENHVVDGVVSGHCDCMFMVNAFGWDYPTVAALAAPRAMMISNSDSDTIFPLDGVLRVHAKVRDLYQKLGSDKTLGLNITHGPHQDTQDLQIPAFHWMRHYLQKDDSLIDQAARPLCDMQELKVFATLPSDEKNTTIDQLFVPKATNSLPEDAAQWDQTKQGLLDQLNRYCFANWPKSPEVTQAPASTSSKLVRDNLTLETLQFTSQDPYQLSIWTLQATNNATSDIPVALHVLDQQQWISLRAKMIELFGDEFLANLNEMSAKQDNSEAVAGSADAKWLEMIIRDAKDGKPQAFFAPRGVGPTAWKSADDKAEIQIKRRFYLLGQTIDSAQVWDIKQAAKVLAANRKTGVDAAPLTLVARGEMGVNCLYAGLVEQDVDRLELSSIPASHESGPYYLNVSRYLDIPQAAAVFASQRQLVLQNTRGQNWDFIRQVAKICKWPGDRLQILK